ncbi:MAG: hypothetical protein LBT09_15565 [Planctomycetaceae bacterium]|jgi:hypothetical protein|nr:hypothetical protein [Planctomycetaceae bacterium]
MLPVIVVAESIFCTKYYATQARFYMTLSLSTTIQASTRIKLIIGSSANADRNLRSYSGLLLIVFDSVQFSAFISSAEFMRLKLPDKLGQFVRNN